MEGNQEASAEICHLKVTECRMAQLCFSPQPEVPRAHRLEVSHGTLKLSLSASAAALSGLEENNTPAVCQGDICSAIWA